jgi:phosphatidylinositol glycan class V
MYHLFWQRVHYTSRIFCYRTINIDVIIRLTLELLPGNKRLAMVSSIAFCLSPPAMFMSSFYTESIFALLSFTGMRLVAKKNYVCAALIWGVTSAIRSNAIIYSGFFFYDLVWLPLIRRKVISRLAKHLAR